jgi:hypothetical protein
LPASLIRHCQFASASGNVRAVSLNTQVAKRNSLTYLIRNYEGHNSEKRRACQQPGGKVKTANFNNLRIISIALRVLSQSAFADFGECLINP